jgi:acyl carrier protein
MKITKDELISMITNALDADDVITLDSTMDDISEWDSLGHLSILTSLDEATDGKASSLSELGDSSSVNEIISILEKENLIDES